MTCFTFIFDEKVATVRASTADAPSPMFSTVPLNRSVAHCVTSGHWPSLTSSLLSFCFWTSSARPISCRRMSWRNISLLAPYLVELFNRPLQQGVVPTVFKAAFISPLLKKPELDPTDVKTYRPISNLSVLSKLLERLVIVWSPTSNFGCASICRHSRDHASPLCSWYWHIRRFRCHDAVSCCQNRIELFRHPTPNSQHPSISHEAGTANARCLIGVDAIELRQCNSRRPASPAIRQTQVRHACSRQTGLLCPEARSCDSASARSSLVTCIAENRIPSGGAGVPLSTRYGSIYLSSELQRVSDAVSGRRLRSASTTALVVSVNARIIFDYPSTPESKPLPLLRNIV